MKKEKTIKQLENNIICFKTSIKKYELRIIKDKNYLSLCEFMLKAENKRVDSNDWYKVPFRATEKPNE